MASPPPLPEVRRLVEEPAEVWSPDLSSFAFVSVVWQVGDQYFHSRTDDRFFDASTQLHTLEGFPISKKDICVPLADSANYTRAPTPLGADLYVKRPCLLDYDPEKCYISDLLRHELEILEVLRRHPHPSIVVYHGYVAEGEWIVGLGLEKYHQTLSSAKREGKVIVADQVMEELEEAVQHLHSLGYVHNDINPRNIMFDNNGRAVLIDFDSCQREGAKLVTKGGTMGFFRKTDRAERENDFYALKRIAVYLEEGWVIVPGQNGLDAELG